jgi:hypothetical protein
MKNLSVYVLSLPNYGQENLFQKGNDMALLAFSDDPETGQRVWIEERSPALQPNGTIINIDEEAGEFDVQFDATTRGNGWETPGGDIDTYPIDLLDGNWTDALGGYWHVPKSVPDPIPASG